MQPRHSAPRCSSSLARARVTARGEHKLAQQLPGAMRVRVQSASVAHGASSAPPHSSCAFSAASAAVSGREGVGTVSGTAGVGAAAAGAAAVARGAERSFALG